MFAKSLLNQNQALTLQELIDLEWQVQTDKKLLEQGEPLLAERDRVAGRMWQSKRAGNQATLHKLDQASTLSLLRHWLQELNHQRPPATQGLYQVLRASDRILYLLAVLLGYFAMAIVLDYDGSHPIDSMYFLAFFVLFQWLMIAFAAYGMWKALVFPPKPNDQQGLVALLSSKLIAKLIALQVRLSPGSLRQTQPFRLILEKLPQIHQYLVFRSLQALRLKKLATNEVEIGPITSFQFYAVILHRALAHYHYLQVRTHAIRGDFHVNHEASVEMIKASLTSSILKNFLALCVSWPREENYLNQRAHLKS